MSGSDEAQDLTAVSTSLLDVNVVSSTPAICVINNRRVIPVASGTCILGATQSGDQTYREATPATATFSITKADQTLTFPSLNNMVFASADQSLGATSTSGLAITYQSDTSQICSIVSDKVHTLAVGTCTITASQSGNTLFNAASALSRSLTISQATNTITFTRPTSIAVGDPDVAISAIASSGLAVTVTSETTGICTIVSSKLHAVQPGTCSLVASQSGNSNFASATSVTETTTILGLGSQSISFSPNVMFIGESDQLLSATATSGLAVSYVINSGSTCSLITNGNLQYIRADSAGSCSITASQAGNSSYEVATPVTRSFQVALELPQIWSGPTYSGFAGNGSISTGTTLTLSGEDIRHASTITFEWYRCTSRLTDTSSTLPSGCEANPVGTGRSYTTVSADYGKYLSMTVVATNTAGTLRTWIQGTPRITFNPAIGFEVALAIGNGSYSLSMKGNHIQYLIPFQVNVGSVLKAKPNIAMPEGVTWRVRWYQCKTQYPWTDYKYYQGTPNWQTFNSLTCQGITINESYTVQSYSQGSFLVADVIFTGSTCYAVAPYGSTSITECHSLLTGPWVYDSNHSEGVVVAPTISGTFKAGSYLSYSNGLYSSNTLATYGNSPSQNTWGHYGTSYTATWYACTTISDSSTVEMPQNCTNLWANSSGPLLNDSEIGKYVGAKIEVTVTGRGTFFLWWSGGKLVQGTKPVFNSASGLAPAGLYSYAGYSYNEGYTVTTNWTSHPAPTLTYQWYRCISAATTQEGDVPSNCTAVLNATTNTYRTSVADALSYLALAVHADSGYGTTDAIVGTSKPVLSSPYNTTAPTVTYATDGSRVATIDPGVWSGSPAPTYTYSWYWCYSGTALSAIRTSGSNQTCWSIASGQTWVYDSVNYSRHVIAVLVKASNSYGRDVEAWAIWQHP